MRVLNFVIMRTCTRAPNIWAHVKCTSSFMGMAWNKDFIIIISIIIIYIYISLPNWCVGHSSCCTRRAPVTTWRTVVRSASFATRTSCSLPSWRVGWWRCWRTDYRTPRLDSGRLEDAGTTFVPSDGSSTWSSGKADNLSSPSSCALDNRTGALRCRNHLTSREACCRGISSHPYASSQG